MTTLPLPSEPNQNKLKICAVVPNAATRDGRVVKQARSLRDAGHEIHLIGIQEAKYPSYREMLDGNIHIYRVPHSESIPDEKLRLNFFHYLKLFGILTTAVILFLMLLVKTSFIVSTDIDTNGLATLSWDAFRPVLGSALYISIPLLILAVVYRIVKTRFGRKARGKASLGNFLSKALISRATSTKINIRAKRNAFTTEFSKKIIELEPDLIYCHEVVSLPGCVKAKRKLRVPLIYDAHEFYDGLVGDDVDVINIYNEKIHRKFLHHADLFITVSQTILELYQEKYRRTPKNTLILPNSVIAFCETPYDGRLHAAAKLPLDRKVVLYQGGISTHRKCDEIVTAAKFLPDPWSVVLMGTGKEREEFESQAASINFKAAQKFLMKSEDPKIIAMLAERAEYYFDQMQSYGEKSSNNNKNAEQGQAQIVVVTNPDAANSQQQSDLNIESYFSSHFREAFTKFAAKSSATNLPKRKAEQLFEDFSKQERNLFDQVERLIDVRSSLHEKHWKLAQSLAALDILLSRGDELEIPPKISIIDPAPQEELLQWTQGGDVGVIPYPVTSENHWGCAPNKLWEYPGGGVPILATPSREVSKKIYEEGIGWCMGADPSATSIVNAIRKISDEELITAKENCKTFIQNSNWLIHSAPWVEAVGRYKPKKRLRTGLKMGNTTTPAN